MILSYILLVVSALLQVKPQLSFFARWFFGPQYRTDSTPSRNRPNLPRSSITPEAI